MKSINMTTWSVRAILAGRKTQTRRPRPGGRFIGKVGDILYVREAHKYDHAFGRVIYRADRRDDEPGPWRPARFHAQRHARLFLELLAVREEPLHAITPEDAIAEGTELPADMLTLWSTAGAASAQASAAALDSFRVLWDSIYRELGAGWAAAPSVAVYTFRPILKGEIRP